MHEVVPNDQMDREAFNLHMRLTDFEIVVVAEPTSADRDAILAPLVAYNTTQAGPSGFYPVVLSIKDAGGQTVGGLWGKCAYDWLFVELLVVPEIARGHSLGRSLMNQAEKIAIVRNCAGAWLDTFNFQARGFYEKLGYHVFGEIPDHPRGGVRCLMQKRF